MNKMILSSYSLDEINREIRSVFEELLGRKLSEDITIDGCIGGVEFGIERETEFREKFLTRGEVAKLLKISLPTLHRYTKDSILKSYRIGGKVRFKLSEVLEAPQARNFDLPKKGGSHV